MSKVFKGRELVISICAPLLLLTSSFLLCCGDDPSSSENDCEDRGTATLTLANKSSNTKYDVVVDGSRIGSIWPSQSLTETVNSGSHSVKFKFSQTGELACNEATPNVAKCASETIACSRDK